MTQYEIIPSARFQKDLKLAQKRGRNLQLLTEIIKSLADGKPLDPKYKDHPLTGDYSQCRECHIQPDWLLIYQRREDALILYLMRTGSHSDLF